MEWLVACLLVLPALWLGLIRSSLLLDYVFFVVALNRGIRRLVDFYWNEAFNPYSPISLTPLLVAAIMLYPALTRFGAMPRANKRVLSLLFIALGYGFLVGFATNGLAAVYSLGEWLSAVAAFAFAASAPVSARTADRWIKSCGWAAVLVAVYGWYQYMVIPEWDAFWVEAVGFVGYLGNLIPTEMAVFSTMHERGPCASFLAWAAVPMILDKRWRIAGSWFTVLLLLSVVMLTMTRTMFIVVGLVAILHAALSRGRSLASLLVFATAFTLALSFGMDHMPGAERVQKRFDTMKDIQEDGSYKGRLEILTDGVPWVLRHPIGSGLGSSGVGATRGLGSQGGFADSGYIQIFGQFGWFGGLCFFAALWGMWSEIGKRLGRGANSGFLSAGRAILLGCAVFLYVGDIFSGFSLCWVFFGIAINRLTLPYRRSITPSPASRPQLTLPNYDRTIRTA